MKKIIPYFTNMKFDSIKVIFFIIVNKLFKIHNNKFVIKIKNIKTGKKDVFLRPFTTDIKVLKHLLIDNGEYDFLYDSKYKKFKKSKVIIDAGANIGLFSRIINEFTSGAKIFAIEPENGNFDVMKKNLRDNNYICLKNGLWNKKCNLIVESTGTGEWGFIVKETKDKYDVLGISITDIMKQYNIDYIDILKIDIEGCEYDVFDDSCLKWLNKVKLLIIEIHDNKRKGCSSRVLNQMKKNNFEYNIYNETYVFINGDFK